MTEQLRFTQKWDGSFFGLDLPAIWDLIGQRCGVPHTILEVGSFEGFSACKMIELFAAHHPIALTCIDSWAGMIYHDQPVGADHEALFHQNLAIAIQHAPHPVTLRTVKSDAYLALSTLIHQGESETFDWIYLDGSHDSQDVLCEAVAAFKLLRSGGILIFDDYVWNEALLRGGHVNNTPKPAIDAFINIYFDKLTVMNGAALYQLYVRKL